MIIIRRLNYTVLASVIVLSVSVRPVHKLGENSPNSYVHKNNNKINIYTNKASYNHRTNTTNKNNNSTSHQKTKPDAASIQFNLLMMSI